MDMQTTILNDNFDYAKIEIALARKMLADAKKKSDLVPLAMLLGVVRTKTEGEKTLIAALRGLIANKLDEIEREREDARRARQKAAEAAAAPEAPAPLPLLSEARKPRVRLTNEQRARKLARNRRKHKRALARRRFGWANGQITARQAAA